jgi:hypothetical protein
MVSATTEPTKDKSNKVCFVIMPISDPDGYEKGHFKKVYEDIFKVAIDKAGFVPIRADEVLQTNFIHLDILQKLIESPMAICDLSSRNPNVLFELGLRQAFDKPTVLVQEFGTQKIFDIAPLRMTDYRKDLRYREVLEDQISISEAIKATKVATDNGEGINSLINLLSLSSPATLKDVTDKDSTKMFQIMMAEINELRGDFRHSLKRIDERSYIKPEQNEFEQLDFELAELNDMITSEAPKDVIYNMARSIERRTMRMLDICSSLKAKVMVEKRKNKFYELMNSYESKLPKK